MIDERTPKRGFALPYVSNSLKEDVARLRETITALDEVLMDGDVPTSYDAVNITYTPPSGSETTVKAKLDLLSDAKNINYSPATGGNKTVAATFDDVNGYLQKISYSFTSTPGSASGVDPRIVVGGNMSYLNIQQKRADLGASDGSVRVRFLNGSDAEVGAIAHDGFTGYLYFYTKDVNIPGTLKLGLRIGATYNPITVVGLPKTGANEAVALNGAAVRPVNASDQTTLGTSAIPWSTVYASSSTIQQSDERLKQDIAPIPDEVLDAWSEVEFVQFRFIDRVAEKGDAARLHAGVIAQRVKEAFERHGVDPFEYGVLCYDEWEATQDDLDGDGSVIVRGYEAGNKYSVRYEEAHTLEAALMRREMKRMKEALGKS